MPKYQSLYLYRFMLGIGSNSLSYFGSQKAALPELRVPVPS